MKCKTGGEDVRPRHCRLWLLNATTLHELRCLLNDNVNVQQRPNRVWYAQAHDLAERAVGFVSNDHGDSGGVRGLKDKLFSGLRGLVGENTTTPHTCLIACVRVWF